jgi:radical SAM protein with 4Fe4S-binding SPASM domain
MNTRFGRKGLESKKGPVKMMSSTEELRTTFSHWIAQMYDILGVEGEEREKSLGRIGKLVSFKWNVVEIYPNIFFETYVLNEWGHAFDGESVRDAWAGYCYGMRDHFSILYNGDVTLCCIDFDGKTKVGNIQDRSLRDVLSEDQLKEIIEGFKKFRLVHPHCKKCLGSRTFTSWLFKPFTSVIALKALKPFFYSHSKIY